MAVAPSRMLGGNPDSRAGAVHGFCEVSIPTVSTRHRCTLQMKERRMAMDEPRTGLEAELGQAVDDLHAALQRAIDATASIKTLLPKVGAISGLFEHL